MTPNTASVPAQAKVNLSLRILAREVNGYHQLETLFCRLDLADQVRVRTAPGGRSLDCAGPAMPSAGLGPVEHNLAWRAAVAFAESAGWPGGFAIEIDKVIPVGGGLGGGSADAGAVLRTLNAMAPRPLTPDRLLHVAGGLGADVPFLTQDASTFALAWGRGDRLLTLPPLPSRPCLVVSAPFGVNTAEAYQWFAEGGATSAGACLMESPDLGSWKSVDVLSVNDFEAVVFARRPALGAVHASLVAAGARGVRMSGSGSTLFAFVDAHTDGSWQPHLPPGFAARLTTTAAAVAPVTLGS